MKPSRSRAWTAFALILAALSSSVCLAKGKTIQVSISGPGIARPIHTSDRAVIAPSPWGGDFAQFKAGPVVEPPKDLPRYQVHLWVDLGGSTEMKYTILFVPDPATGRSSVHIPGKLDRWYANNVFTILRGNEGQWFAADPSWAQATIRVIGK